MPLTEFQSTKVARLAERVSRDPASALFLPLAEAYRQQGRPAVAESVLRAGLSHHKVHYSARTALGRVLLELGRVEEALLELESVHLAVPDNLLAARLLEEARGRQEKAHPAVLHEDEQVPPTPAAEVQESPAAAGAEPIPDALLPAADAVVARRVAALRRFLAGAVTLRGRHA